MRYLIIIFLILAGGVMAAPIAMAPTMDLDSLNYDTSKLEADITSLGGVHGKGIKEYFTGQKPYITIDERDEWIFMVNRAIKELRITTLGPVTGKEEIIKKLNYSIGELSKRVK